MIRIDFYVKGEDDPIAGCSWVSVPRPGDSIVLNRQEYRILSVNWGHYVDGTGRPLYEQPCVAIELEVRS